MLKRWAAWLRKHWAAPQQGIRRLVGGIAVVVLAVAIAWVLFVPAADWLAHHDVGSAKGSLQTARDAARGRLLTFGAGLFAAGALVFTARNFTLSREGQVTDRYTKAIEQLGSDKLDVRIGGIYALERVARDSATDHPTVMEVLTAFIRDHSHEPWPRRQIILASQEQEHSTRPDVQAAVTVVGRRRRDQKRDLRPIDLTRADLTGAHLTGADLTGAHLTDADLTRADLTDAHLTARTSLARTSAARTSPARTSTRRSSPARTSTARPQPRGPRRRAPPARTSSTRTSTARTSPARTSARASTPRTSTARPQRRGPHRRALNGADLNRAQLRYADLNRGPHRRAPLPRGPPRRGPHLR